MIDSAKIVNFQSHEKADLEFDDGVNIIVGSSDSGKSAILRAMIWNITNSPSGDAFRSFWARKSRGATTESELKLSGGTAVNRKRTASQNQYELNGNTLDAINRGIPNEVRVAHNMADVNIQSQHDPIYFLSNTSGGRARQLNELIGLEIMSDSVKSGNKERRRLSKRIEGLEESVKSIEASLKPYALVDKIKQLTDKAEKADKNINQLNTAISTLSPAVHNLHTHLIRLDKLKSGLPEVIKARDLIEESLEAQRDTQEAISDLSSLIDEVEKEMATDYLKPPLRELEDTLREVEDAGTAQQTIKPKIRLLKKLISSAVRTKRSMSDKQTQLDNIQEQREELMPDNCPFCGAELERDKCR